MTNRITGEGMDAAPLGRDDPHPDTAAELARLHDLWRDAKARLRATIESTIPGIEPLRPAMATQWRREVNRFECEAARLALIERSLMFHDEAEPPDGFAPVYLKFAPDRSIYVAPGAGPDFPCVMFYPSEPALLPNATAEEATP